MAGDEKNQIRRRSRENAWYNFDVEPNILINLPGFTLPRDYAWRVGIVDKVNRHLRELAERERRNLGIESETEVRTRSFLVPRFAGYYFIERQPVALTSYAQVNLDREHPIAHLAEQVDAATEGQYRIVNAKGEAAPLYILVHDRHTEACWLQRFEHGKRFVTAVEPVGVVNEHGRI